MSFSFTRKLQSVTSDTSSSKESRRRQSKRDDAIIRKIEYDLSKKRKNNTKSFKNRKGAPGTVMTLKPADAVTCKPSTTVFEASQLMTVKRENCILVVNDESNLLGIFTAKDLAFRIVGSNLNASTVTIDKIMTTNPLCAKSSDPASDALSVMVEKGFRHLPVLNEQEEIMGVLDITKCYALQMEKLEKRHESYKKLYEALDTVQSEVEELQQPLQVLQYFESLKSKMSSPTLESVLDASTMPVYCSTKTSVYEATVLMKENKTTAVLIKDSEGKVNGIFTSKDVVLRVIAAGLNPKQCSIVRVMTPLPDLAPLSLPIQEALRKMFEGRYLNLPVIDETREICGIVDVLKLTYVTINQLKQINENESQTPSEIGLNLSVKNNEGPAWNKFWTSLDNESDSGRSDSSPAVLSDRPQTPVRLSSRQSIDFPQDINPSDSVSHVDTPTKVDSRLLIEEPFVFKFRCPSIENSVYRVTVKPSEGIVKLREAINEKLHPKDFEILQVRPDELYCISYMDDEGDFITITSDDDLIDCFKVNKKLSNEKADLFLYNPHDGPPVKRKIAKPAEADVLGIPLEILIPGMLVVLGSVAIFGFSMTRK